MRKAYLLIVLFLAACSSTMSAVSGSTRTEIKLNEVSLVGQVNDHMYQVLVDETKIPATTTIIYLNSGGGSVSIGDKIVAYIAKMRRYSHVVTYVQDYQYCESKCVDIYMQGDERYAGPNARFMLHAAQYTLDGANYIDERASQRSIDMLIARGANEQWVNYLVSTGVLRIQGVPAYFYGDELVDRKTGIVLALMNPSTFYYRYGIK